MTKNMFRLELLLRMPGLAVLAMLLLAKALFGQNWVEQRTYVSGSTATPRIDGLLTHPLHKTIGTFMWFQVQQTYSEAYGGITYLPRPWIQIAIGPGLEQDKHPARIGSYIWVGKGKASALGIFEDGGSGFWYKVECNYQITPMIGIGMNSEHFRGTGPKLEYSINRTPIKLWFSPLILNGSVRSLVGIRLAL